LYYRNISQFNALDIRLKTDGRLYVAQLKSPVSFEHEDLYQIILPPLPPNQWTRLLLPLDEFLLTWRGGIKDTQPQFPTSGIETFGILMAERRDGDFWMNIDWIKLVDMQEATRFDQEPSPIEKTEQSLIRHQLKEIALRGGRTEFRKYEKTEQFKGPLQAYLEEEKEKSQRALGIVTGREKIQEVEIDEGFNAEEYKKLSGISYDEEEQEFLRLQEIREKKTKRTKENSIKRRTRKD